MSVSSSVGPISGIDYGKLITGLIGIEQRPIDIITKRLTKLEDQNTAFTSLATKLTSLKLAATNFSSAAIFRAATAASSNTSVLNATAGIGTPIGSYNFIVQRLASASQAVSQGFADTETTSLGLTGNVKIQLGKGRVDDVATLASLNGGAGVARGSIRIADRSGASTIIDLTTAVDAKDVINAINSTTGVNVLAKMDGDKLVITDNATGAGNLTITDAGGTTTATDLGLTVASVAGTLTGSSLTKLRATTTLDSLNNGNGVRNAAGLDDFSITGATGTANISLSGTKSIGDIITKINAQSTATGVSATISTTGHGLTLTDAGAGPVSVTAFNGSLGAYDLGFQTGTAAANTLTGDLNSVLLSQLGGGYRGATDTLPTLGTLTINGESVDLSSARTLNDVVKTFNTNTQGVTAAINENGTGISLTSTVAAFTIADGTGTLGAFLNINGTSAATATGSKLASGDLHFRALSENSLLSSLGGGNGFKPGKIRITDGTGAVTTLDLAVAGVNNVGDVIKRINAVSPNLNARINDNGDGLVLTQTTGALDAHIDEVEGGSTAASLGIKGTFAAGTLNGSFEKTIAVVATDKLVDIQKKINDAGLGVAANIINDGSGNNPFRLSLASRNSGNAGRLIFDGSEIGLNLTTLVEATDSVVVFGTNANGSGGLVATSSSNSFSSLVPSLNINISGLGTASVSVTRDDKKISDSLTDFTKQYNDIHDVIKDLTKFDPSNPDDKGILFGDPTIQMIQQSLGNFLTQSFVGVGLIKNLSGIGIKVTEDGGLDLDTNKLTGILASNPEDIRSLFTTKTTGAGPALTTLIDRFTDSSTGLIFRSTDAIESQTKQLNDRSTSLNTLLNAKKNRLIRQFANLEVSISKLQQQGTALSSYATQQAKG